MLLIVDIGVYQGILLTFYMASEGKSPIEALGTSDPGDDVQRRFRYQAIFTAKLALGMLIERTGIVEIYCEHHDDVIVRLSTGKFQACQIKTRDPGLGPFKSSDPAMVNTISRFVGLETQFPGHFEKFVIAVNCGFWSAEADSQQNLHCFIASACSAINDRRKPTRGTLAEVLQQIKSELHCEVETILQVICKIQPHDGFPSFSSAPKELVYDIGSSLNQETTLDRLCFAADQLVGLILKASSLAIESSLTFYFAFLKEPLQTQAQERIAGKRITKTTIEDLLTNAIGRPPLLTSDGVPRLTTGFSNAEVKMTAGSISQENIESIRGFQNSLEVLLDSWGYKYSFDEAQRRYNNLRLIVREQCLDAETKTRIPHGTYGNQMLTVVRDNLKQRYQMGMSEFGGCKYEHLLGVVGDLTEDCTVWWSNKFEIG